MPLHSTAIRGVVETRPKCGGAVKIMPKALAPLAGQAVASTEESELIEKILAHVNARDLQPDTTERPPRAARRRGGRSARAGCKATQTCYFSSRQERSDGVACVSARGIASHLSGRCALWIGVEAAPRGLVHELARGEVPTAYVW